MNSNCNQQLIDHRLDLLPSIPTTNSNRVNRKHSFGLFQRLKQMSTNLKSERCCFLSIHLLFYTLILLIIYLRFEQFSARQEQLFLALRLNENFTLNKEHQRRLLNNQEGSYSEINADCSCQTNLPHPKRNRTSRCLQIRVGLNDVLENVFCQNDDYPQWLVIQNRQTNLIDFNRSWFDYRRGFGNVLNQSDFWIGNENLHWLTNNYPCRLKIELTDWYNETRTAIYETFRIADQKDGYRIHLSGYQGDMEPINKIDSFSRWHQNARFSTYDHYATTTNCPQKHGGGGWWFHSGSECAHVQLNGRFATHSDGLVPYNTGILWIGWKSDRHYSFQSAHMAIQPRPRSTRVTHQD